MNPPLHFTSLEQCNTILSFKSIPLSMLSTLPPLPNCHIITLPPLWPCHLTVLLHFPTCHLAPPINLSHLPSSLLSHFSQLTSVPKTNTILQNGNVLSLGRQGKHVGRRVRQPLMKVVVWDPPLALRDLAEAIGKPKFSHFHYNSLPFY